MEIPQDILEQLKCSACRNYISYSPVYLQHNGLTICGECYNTFEEKIHGKANRMLKYEALAKIMKFPCKNQIHGCKEVIPFIGEHQENLHEKVCKFRNISCPISYNTSCNWIGQVKQILGHFKTKHPNHVEKNPCVLKHDMVQFNIKTYIIQCFDLLFLLYTKVCLATGKIFHAVQLLDDPEKISEFKYVLKIQREELVISRPGKIISRNCNVDENTSLVTNISSLLAFLDGLNDTEFTINIQKNVKDETKLLKETSQYLQEIKMKPSTSTLTLIEDRSCRYNHRGCTFKDIDVKCDKHEELFCSFRNWCWSCSLPTISKKSNDWSQHNTSNHKRLTYENGKYFQLKSSGLFGRSIFVNTSIGNIYCRYFFYNTTLKIYIWTPSNNKNLSKYNCDIGLKQIQKDNTDIVESCTTLKPCIDKMWDFYAEQKPKKLFPNFENLEMFIHIYTNK